MAHKLLKELDAEYRQKRAEVIAKNYEEIVSEIHDFFQLQVIILLSPIKVKEITKFDYMTNLDSEGDKHLWIDFIDDDGVVNHFKTFINTNSGACELNQEKYLFDEIGLGVDIIETFSILCLSEFRRGYDKPKQL